MTEILAIIPARGGSKRIPRKNIRPFCGYPLLAWSIAATKKSKLVNRTIVSTDNKEIAKIAKKFGAEVPFLRPSGFAQDDSPDFLAFEHALKWLKENENYQPDIVIQLRPTSPLRPPDLLDNSVKILNRHKDADCVRAVIPAGQNPYKMWRLSGVNKPMKNLLNIAGIAEPYNAPRQSLPAVYWQTGHIDVIRTETILKGSMSGKKIYPIIVDPRYAIDIDTLYDWERAEYIVSTGVLDLITPK